MLGDAEALNAYHAAIDSFYKNNLIKKSVSGFIFISEMFDDIVYNKMDHLACCAGSIKIMQLYFARHVSSYPEIVKIYCKKIQKFYVIFLTKLYTSFSRHVSPWFAT